MPTKNQTVENKKNKLYNEITQHCDWLHIARYLKNEAKSALKYFHVHKLSNIKKNLKEFSDYLIFLNDENCERIEWFTEWKESISSLNNSISYFYDYENISPSDLSFEWQKVSVVKWDTISKFYSTLLDDNQTFWMKYYVRRHPDQLPKIQEWTYIFSWTYTSEEFLSHIGKTPS